MNRKWKIMLVDDEILAIQHIRSMVLMQNNSYEIVAEATSSTKALQLFRDTEPDIVFLDIQVPGKNGLELAREFFTLKPFSKIIILTSYKDFDYAKDAIEIGVTQYLVKHELTQEKLFDLLQRNTRALETAQKNQLLSTSRYIRNLLRGGFYTDQGSVIGAKRPGIYYTSLLVYLDVPFPVVERVIEATAKGTFPALDEWEYSSLPEVAQIVATLEISMSRWLLLLQIEGTNSEKLIGEAVALVTGELRARWKAESGYSISVIKSALFADVRDLPLLYEKVEQLSWLGVFFGRNTVTESTSAFVTTPANNATDWVAQAQQFATLQVDQAIPLLGTLFHTIRVSHSVQQLTQLCRDWLGWLDRERTRHRLPALATVVKDEDTEQWYDLDAIEIWIIRRTEETIAQIHGVEKKTYSRKVRLILQYIHEHYPEPLTVEVIAESLYLNGDYLRHLFRTEVGKTVLDYITEYRIHKAKELLAKGDYKIYEVAEKVGYNSQYFSQVFRKVTGLSPLAFMERKNDDEI